MKPKEKIRKFRLLKGWTMTQLGKACGFEAAADVRIAKYENGSVVPRDKIKASISKALDVDIEAIFNEDTSSCLGAMHVLFDLEDKYGINSVCVSDIEGEPCIVIRKNGNTSHLIGLLNVWKNKKSEMFPDGKKATDEQIREYELWKGRFGRNIRENYESKKSEAIDLAQKLSNSGFTVLIDEQAGRNKSGKEITLVLKDVLNPPTKNSAKIISTFNDIIESLGSIVSMRVSNINAKNGAVITYFIPENAIIEEILQ